MQYIELIFYFFICVLALTVLVPSLSGAPFVPTARAKVLEMMEMGDVGPGKKVVDLGSGDGRIVIEAAKRGARAYGYELNLILVLISRRAIKKLGLGDNACIYWKSFWKADLEDADVVTIFGLKGLMADLGAKLKRELKPGAKVISFAFTFPGWNHVKGERALYLYVQS